AADQTSVVLGIVVEVEGERARLLLLHHLARRLPHLGLDAAAANGAGDRAVVAYQHLRRLERRDRAANVGDSRNRSPPPFAAKLHDLFVDVHEEPQLATGNQQLALTSLDGIDGNRNRLGMMPSPCRTGAQGPHAIEAAWDCGAVIIWCDVAAVGKHAVSR